MTKCDHCDNPAIYHDVRIVDNVHNTTHLCAEHALASGIDLGPVDISVVLHTSDMLNKAASTNSCPDCGMTIAQYKEKTLLGCPTCYATFSTELRHIIANVQENNTQHIGRSPSQSNERMDRNIQIRRLLKQLSSAVNHEEYEQAALLRDQLRELHDSGDLHEN